MPIMDKKNDNKVFFKKINTSAYETNRIQDNIEDSFNNLALSVKNKQKNYCMVFQKNSATIANGDFLFFDTVIIDQYECFKNNNSFISPITGIINFNLNAQPIGFSAGAQNFISAFVNNNIILYVVFGQVFFSQSWLSFNCFLNVKQNDSIKFKFETDSGTNPNWGTPQSFMTMRWD